MICPCCATEMSDSVCHECGVMLAVPAPRLALYRVLRFVREVPMDAETRDAYREVVRAAGLTDSDWRRG